MGAVENYLALLRWRVEADDDLILEPHGISQGPRGFSQVDAEVLSLLADRRSMKGQRVLYKLLQINARAESRSDLG